MKNTQLLPIHFFFILLLFCQLLYAQEENLDKQIKYRSGELEKIRSEIEEYQRNLEQVEQEEENLLNTLQETEQAISLTQKLVSQLAREQKQKEAEIRKSQRSIMELEGALEELKARFARRLVHIYKRGEPSDLELLLTAESLNQAFYRYKYMQIITDIDRQIAEDIRETIRSIDSRKTRIQRDVNDRAKIINEKTHHQDELKSQKRSRTRQLENARKNKDNLLAQIEEKQQAAEKLSRLIATLENERAARRRELARQRALSGITEGQPFESAQGQLIWPVSGEVVSRFGRHKHPTLNTVTQSSGIDIRAQKGEQVRAVMDGVVTTITYIRGFGNTVIVDHGSGYYTVYTHIDDVFVYENQYITAGSVIALVGDTGSLEGSLLHFEIWKNRTALNPEDWLSKGL